MKGASNGRCSDSSYLKTTLDDRKAQGRNKLLNKNTHTPDTDFVVQILLKECHTDDWSLNFISLQGTNLKTSSSNNFRKY